MPALINVPVSDLRKEPKDSVLGYRKDPLQESQLIFGEELVIKDRQDGWYFVEAVEQQKCHPDGIWTGYPGWIKAGHVLETKKNSLPALIVGCMWGRIFPRPEAGQPVQMAIPLGSRICGVEKIPEWWKIKMPDGGIGYMAEKDVCPHRELCQTSQDAKRKKMVALGRAFLDFPYLWGGRSTFASNASSQRTGVDCSGLANLLYRSQGIEIPRDAHDQFLKSRPCEYGELQPGDLVFTSEPFHSQRIGHAMVYAGNGILLEACLEAHSVRCIPFANKFGVEALSIQSGETIGVTRVFFGKFI